MMFLRIAVVVLLAVGDVALGLFFAKAPKLGKYNVDPNTVTVSGISSGGAMSSQFHFIYSSEVKGAGVFAAGPYLCGYDGLVASGLCMTAPTLLNLPSYIQRADNFSNLNAIDNVSSLKGSKAYIFHGTKDIVVNQGSGKLLKDMYDHYGANVHAEFSIASGHGQPVSNGLGGPCESSLNVDKKFANECGYDGAYEMFKWMYGDSIVAPPTGFKAGGKLVAFDQSEFISGLPILKSMSADGYLYVPTGCQSGTKRCRFHIAFHGCLSNEQLIGRDYAMKTQYADVAELNDIVILFPQTSLAPPMNPQGCWDWFGYTGQDSFATKKGAQPSAVYKMMKRVLGA